MALGLSAYRRLLSDAPARAFSLAGFLARMPISMTSLGTVLLVSLATGSFGRAGVVAGVGTVAGALASPLWGRLIDRVGQARVLVSAAAINGVSVGLLILTVELGWPLVSSLGAAVGVGLGLSSAGASVRARWTHRLAGSPNLDTAFAVEAILDEVVFIIGPVLATFLATSVHPALGLGAAVVLGLTGAIALAGQRATQPPIGPVRNGRRRLEPISIARLLPITLAGVAVGAIFGGMEVVVVAFAKSAGVIEYAGFILLAWALGSLLSGLVVGTITWRATPARRFQVSAVLLAVSTIPLPFLHNPWWLTAMLVLSGLAISPTMIASVTVTQAAVPPSRLTESFGWTSMGLATGLAIGAATSGQVIDSFGARAGFWAIVIFGAVLIVFTLWVRAPGPGPTQTPLSPAPPDTPSAEPAHPEAQTRLRGSCRAAACCAAAGARAICPPRTRPYSPRSPRPDRVRERRRRGGRYPPSSSSPRCC